MPASRFLPTLVPAACLFAVVVSGCSLKLPERPASSLDETMPTLPAGVEPALPEEACKQWAKADLAKSSRCENLDWPDSPRRSDHLRALTAFCVARISSPQTDTDERAQLACANALGSSSCDTVPTECRPKKGWGRIGDPCALDDECQSLYCVIRSASGGGLTCGTCQPAAEQGESCESKTCGRGLACSTISKKCVLPGTYSLCETSDECEAQRTCVLTAGSKLGTCAKAAKKGEACKYWNDCETSLLCDGETKKCISPVRLEWRGPRETCDGYTHLCAAGACTSGTCSSLTAEGSACGSAGSAPCDVGLFCFEGKCTSIENFTCH